jgi:RNA polymerase sigma-70 factor (ECF subfamily)
MAEPPKRRFRAFVGKESRPSGPTSEGARGADLDQALAALRPAVRALVGHLLGASPGHPDVDDGENEVYRRTLEGRARIDPAAPLRSWVLGIARHVALDGRRARRRAALRMAGEPSDDDDPEFEQLADAAPGPEERAVVAQRAHRLDQALAQLPGEQRRVLLLHAEGLGYRAIAEHVGAPMGTVCTWISRARRGLADALKDDEDGRS